MIILQMFLFVGLLWLVAAVGTLIAHSNSVIAATSTSIKRDTLVIDSASIAAGKIVIVFVENESGTGDITCQATIKYHLT